MDSKQTAFLHMLDRVSRADQSAATQVQVTSGNCSLRVALQSTQVSSLVALQDCWHSSLRSQLDWVLAAAIDERVGLLRPASMLHGRSSKSPGA